MAYNTKGDSHKQGVLNEEKITDKLNNYLKDEIRKQEIADAFKLEDDEFRFVHVGGTSDKSDMNILGKNNKELSTVSIKKNNEKSTFDLLNTSKIDDYIDPQNKDYIALKNLIEENKGILNGKDLNENYYKKLRKGFESKMKKLANKILNSICHDEIRNILFNLFKSDCDNMMISNFTKGSAGLESELLQYVVISKDDRYDYSSYLDSSAKLSLEDNGKDTASKFIQINGEKGPLRLRLVLNNGVGALMGKNWNKKGKNKTSVLTIKIQVDKVAEVIEKSNHRIIRK